ncbi:MAG: ABC transporter permease [Clostridia bacterium]|nr:ABC transporter permease [Clostridia bacterium]
MYIIKNAFRCIGRAKGRNFLIGLIVVLLSVSSCLGLSIRQANKTLKKQYSDDMEITASLNTKSRDDEITLDTLTTLSKDKSVKSFYKSASVYFSAGDGIEPIDVAGSFKKNSDFKNEYGNIKNGEQKTETIEGTSNTSSSSYNIVLLANEENIIDNTEQSGEEGQEQPGEGGQQAPSGDGQEGQEGTETQKPGNDDNSSGSFPTPPSGDSSGSDGSDRGFDPSQMPGGDTFITKNFFFNMASMNDFTVIGADASALPSYVSSLNCLSTDSADFKCVISKNLAEENELSVGDTFTLKNPENEEETYKFTIAGIADYSESTDDSNTSSNAGFTDNNIYVNYLTVEKIAEDSAALNGDATVENNDKKKVALSASYTGTFVFANLNDFNSFKETVGDKYSVNSEDVDNYNTSVKQLNTLGEYATYFLIVIFVIGGFVLVIINLFSIRNRKYEIGVLTAIGMKKYKVALQFVTELFVVTFAALIIGSSIGAVTSVPVTNKLLKTINTTQTTSQSETSSDSDNSKSMTPPGSSSDSKSGMPSTPSYDGKMPSRPGSAARNYIASVKSATNLTVIFEMIGVGLILTLISSLAAMLFVMRYEPLKILNNRD